MSLQMVARAHRLPVERSGDTLGWLLLIPLGCLVLGQIVLAWSGTLSVHDGGLADPDSYMRLNRVLHLHDTGNWFDSTYPRINPPEGHVQHWTRALDALLLAGAWLLQPFLGFHTGLHVWGALFSPICLALMVLALNWACAPFLARDVRMMACLLLLLQPTVIAYSSLGRADHHALLLLLFVLLLGSTARLLLQRIEGWLPMAAGAIMALSIWISPESLVFLAASLATLGMGWLLGDGAIAGRCKSVLAWATMFLALALLMERGPAGLFAIENDRLSIVHVMLFASLSLFWTGVVPLEERYRLDLRYRLPLAAGGVMAVAGVMLALFPTLIQGPLGTVDPLYKELRLDRIVEIQPLIQPHRLAAGDYGAVLGRVITILGIALLAIPYLVRRLLGPGLQERCFWTVVAIGLLAFLPLALHQVRWSSYTQILLVVAYAALVDDVLHRMTRRMPVTSLQFARPGAICVALFWPVLASAALPADRPVTTTDLCSVAELAPELNQLTGTSAKTIMTLADFGSEILYRTPHSVLSIPNHRPQPGFTATHDALTATDPDEARRVLAHHGVDWILLCLGASETTLRGEDTPGEPTLYERLTEGEAPSWLRSLPLTGGSAGAALLYEVVEGAAPAGTAGLGGGR
jgi:hypothetical protein